MANAQQVGADTVISAGADATITLQSVALSSLVPDDFWFG